MRPAPTMPPQTKQARRSSRFVARTLGPPPAIEVLHCAFCALAMNAIQCLDEHDELECL